MVYFKWNRSLTNAENCTYIIIFLVIALSGNIYNLQFVLIFVSNM